jgi:hypothetical protein
MAYIAIDVELNDATTIYTLVVGKLNDLMIDVDNKKHSHGDDGCNRCIDITKHTVLLEHERDPK